MKAVWHMLYCYMSIDYWVILDGEFIGNGYFNVWPEGQVEKGQKWSIFVIQNFEYKTLFADSISSLESGGVFCFCVRCL